MSPPVINAVSALEASWSSLIAFLPLERPDVDRPCSEVSSTRASESGRGRYLLESGAG